MVHKAPGIHIPEGKERHEQVDYVSATGKLFVEKQVKGLPLSALVTFWSRSFFTVETTLCIVGALAASLALTHFLSHFCALSVHTRTHTHTPQLWQPKMSPDIAEYPLGVSISPSWEVLV